MKLMSRLTMAVFILAISATSVSAGVLLVYSQKHFRSSLGSLPEDTTSKIYIDKDCMRVVDEDTTMIYRKDQVVYVIDTERRTYFDMTKDSMKERATAFKSQMSGQMAQMEKMLQETMKNLPPEQRAKMKEMMKGRLPGQMSQEAVRQMQEKEKTVFTKKGRGKVKKWSCTNYIGIKHGKVAKKVCASDPGQLGITQRDFQVAMSMQRFMEEVMSEFSKEVGMNIPSMGLKQGFPGIPVQEIKYDPYDERKIVEQDELMEVRHQNFSASLCDLPAELKRESPFDMKGLP